MDESDLKVLGACVICAALLVVARARAGELPAEIRASRSTPAPHSRVTNHVSAATTIAPRTSRSREAFTTAGRS